jgi:tRNA (adenine-N(1)-)-methyltransferase non-catalytic subunit
VIIACEYEPYSVLEKLLPRIAGSAPIVVYSPLLQVLHEAQQRLKQIPEFLSPSIVEPWLRKYQVLPSRSHPEMAGMGHGGYILTTTRVHDDAGAHSFASGRRDAKKRKHEREAGEEQAAGERASKVSKVEVAA